MHAHNGINEFFNAVLFSASVFLTLDLYIHHTIEILVFYLSFHLKIIGMEHILV